MNFQNNHHHHYNQKPTNDRNIYPNTQWQARATIALNNNTSSFSPTQKLLIDSPRGRARFFSRPLRKKGGRCDEIKDGADLFPLSSFRPPPPPGVCPPARAGDLTSRGGEKWLGARGYTLGVVGVNISGAGNGMACYGENRYGVYRRVF